MSTLKVIILGTVVGLILSILSLGSTYTVAFVIIGTNVIPSILAISTLANGVILGTVGISLSYLTSGLERSGLMVLIGLAVASFTIMLGSYGNGSLLPLGIYFLAVVNSLLISRVTGVITRRTLQIKETYVRG